MKNEIEIFKKLLEADESLSFHAKRIDKSVIDTPQGFRFYCDKISEAARNYCIQNNIINIDQTVLSIEDLSNILNLYKIELKHTKNRASYFMKKKDEMDVLYLSNSIKDDDELAIISCLNALGIKLFGISILKENKKILLDEYGMVSDRILSMVSLRRYKLMIYFPLSFIMPEYLYNKAICENMTTNGRVNMMGVAKKFTVSYDNVIRRGESLGNKFINK